MSVFTIPALLLLCILVGPVHATGMQPETTALLLEEAAGEATIKVKNTDSVPSLLYTEVGPVEGDTDRSVRVMPTSPVVRVEPGQRQLVRLVLQTAKPLKVEHFKRLSFEGIPQLKPAHYSQLGVTVRQTLPLLIRPKGLAPHPAPWRLLRWSVDAKRRLRVQNPSPYVVRLEVVVQPRPGRGERRVLPRPWLLPGETLTVPKPLPASPAVQRVWLEPLDAYGDPVGLYRAQLSVARRRV